MESLSDAPVKHMPRRTLFIILGLQLITGIVYLPVRSFLPVFLKDILFLNVRGVSLIIALGQILAMAASMAAGSLAERTGRKRILLIGLGLFSLGPLMFLSRSVLPSALMAVLFLSCTSFMNMGGMGTLIAETEPSRLGLYSALYHWGITLGGVLGGLAAGFILDRSGYRSLGLFLFSLIGGGGVLIGLFFPGQGKSLTEGDSGFKGQGYLQLLRDRTVLTLGLIRFLPTLYWGMANVLISILIKDVSGSNTSVALYGAVSSALATLAQVIVGRGADMWGSKIPLYACFLLLVLSVFGLFLFPQLLWALFLFGSLAACAAWSLSTMIPIMIREFISGADQDRCLGFVQTAWSAAMVLGTLGGGFLFELHRGLPFGAAALLNIPALFLVYRIYSQKKTSFQFSD